MRATSRWVGSGAFCVVALVVAGCSGGKAADDAAGSSSATSAAAPAADPATELDALLRGISDCALDERGVPDPKCGGNEALRQWQVSHQDWLDKDHRKEAAAVGARYLTNPSPTVRLGALALVGREIKDDAALQAAVTALAKTEKDPHVLAGLAAAAGHATDSAPLRQELLGLLANEDEEVRKAAVTALVPTNEPPRQAVRAGVLGALKGGSMDVKKKICQRLRVGDDPELAKAITSLIDNPATPTTLFDDCFYGLNLSWLAPEVTEPSKIAYEASIACLEKCARDDEHIGLGVSLMQVVISPKPEAKKLPEFADEVRIEKAVLAILKDPKAQPSLRFSAAAAFDDIHLAAKKSGLAPEAIMNLSAKAGDPASHH